MEASYITLYKNGGLQKRIDSCIHKLSSCELCPRACKVNRLQGEAGFCKTGRYAVVASHAPHFGEEAPLVGRYGSGTVFFSGCNLMCVFCQNYDISHEAEGKPCGPEELADIMVSLQNNSRVHNINFVTPSHVIPQILEALPLAIDNGLSVPLVYNSGGYDSVETLKLLEGIFDIYMPDFKFSSDIPPTLYCKAPDYPQVVRRALNEMHRQVGDLVLDENNRAVRGLLVRHLVMPDDLAGTRAAMRFLAQNISANTYVNIMDQYRPCGDCSRFSELTRHVSRREYEEALAAAQQEGITRLDSRERPFLLMWR